MTSECMHLPEFSFEDGSVFVDVPVAYQTWGTLNAARDNVVLVCHALTGNTDIDAWWPGLAGPGRALDPERDFIVCANVIASPYGSLSPLSIDPATGKPYGPSFPVPTIRDTVALHRRLLDALGIRQVAFAIGGSMGGMQVLEWAFFGDFVQALVPIAVGGRHSAWCIAWSEAQRHAIMSDPDWSEPARDATGRGLAIARMMAMISYRSAASFESRFGRNLRSAGGAQQFEMESYLRYQGQKLVDRFDPVCYVRLTQCMDTHDVSRGRGDYADVLASIEQPALVIGIDSDVLYPLSEQRELESHLPNAELAVLHAPHGHDSFLIERDTVNDLVLSWRRRVIDVPPR